ncbi:MAG TPA: aminopeptidase P family N-terminal domain-containing protein [Devosiaceae bacterium]|nr:aminopeptidase P family N-terminal domain-containing protein [Devosiaceae bacterium]
MAARLIDARLPDFGVPTERPELPPALFARRLAAFTRVIGRAGLDAAVVYADREHCANLAYLTGFDPRFEEAVLVVVPGRVPTLFAGPENLGRAAAVEVELDAKLYPPFGLMGQDRSRTPPLLDILRDAGLTTGQKIGVLGWKYFGIAEADTPDSWLEVPSFIADTVRAIAGASGRVVNANVLLMHNSIGLRAVNEVEQIAQFEFSAVAVSEAIKSLVRSLRPGLRELEAAAKMRLNGLPHSCHTMLSTGDRLVGLDSPSSKVIERGDPLTTAVGYWGALSSRVGWVAADEGDLPADAADYVDRLAAPYFACAAEWYETIGIGVPGGEIDALVRRHLDSPFFNLVLNPGHLIHIDEWMNTPVYPGSTERFTSGQMIQCDIIPAVGAPYHSCNIEDGIALLDERGRAEFRDKFPRAAERIEARRAFMIDVLGIRLKPEVMPLSNLAGALAPFLLSPQRIFSMR